jgi:uncharacterized protein (TIRG00374 family)
MFSALVSPFFLVVVFLIAVLIGAMVLVFFNEKFAKILTRTFFRVFSFSKAIVSKKEKASEFLERFYKGIHSLKSANFTKVLLFTAVAWFIEALTLYTAAYALNVHVPLIYCLGFTALAILGGTLSSLPGGLGSTEILLFGFFTLIGYPEALGLSITLLYRFLTFGVGILISSVFFIREMKN